MTRDWVVGTLAEMIGPVIGKSDPLIYPAPLVRTADRILEAHEGVRAERDRLRQALRSLGNESVEDPEDLCWCANHDTDFHDRKCLAIRKIYRTPSV